MQNLEFVNCIKKKEILISVIVPVFNAEKYLQRCLESIICQTLYDIEIIIINHGSTDNSSEIIEKFLTDKRVIYIKQENVCQGAARNKGLELASGEYVGFVNSNDYVDNDFFEKLYKAIKRNDADVAAASIIRKRETFEKWRIFYEKSCLIENKNEMVKALDYPSQAYIWNKIYKRSFLNSFNFKFKENTRFEDICALSSIILNCKKLICVPNTCYYYSLNEGQFAVLAQNSEKGKNYYADKKAAIGALIENGVKIKRNGYFINKREVRFLNLPILKIKEDLLKKCEWFLLFNLIPIFFIKNKNPEL